jgi:hypothetical protein
MACYCENMTDFAESKLSGKRALSLSISNQVAFVSNEMILQRVSV